MALNKTALAATLTGIFGDVTGKTAAQQAQAVADALDLFVKSGTVTVTGTATGALAGGPGVPVVGTGTIA